MQMPVAHNMLESEMIGAIKIKDGLFIGDELASTVSHLIDTQSNVDSCNHIDYFCCGRERFEILLRNYFLAIDSRILAYILHC